MPRYRKKEIFWFDTDLGKRIRIASQYESTSLSDLKLSVRTFNALMRHDQNMSVGDLVRADHTFTDIPNLGVACYKELNEIISELLEGIEDDIELEPAAPTSIPEPEPVDSIKAPPDRVPASIQTLPLNQLQLNLRAHNALIREGITTVGELYNLTRGDLQKIPKLSHKSVKEVKQSLVDLVASIEQDEVNWLRYCNAQEINLLPSSYQHEVSEKTTIGKLPKIIKEILLLDFDERTWIIVQRRFGLENEERLSLEELGEAFGLTREGVRLIENKAKKTLREVLVKNQYVGKRYRLYPKVQSAFNRLCQILPCGSDQLILETDVFNHIRDDFQIDPEIVKNSLYLVFDLTDAKRIEFSHIDLTPVWGDVQEKELAKIRAGIEGIDTFLTRSTSLPQKDFDILLQVNKGLKKSRKLTLNEVRQLVEVCSSVVQRDDGLYWGKFEHLKGRGNQIERILTESTQPMNANEIARIINHRLVPLGQRKVDPRNVVNLISNDSRFVHIGRSGEWGLKSWEHIDTSTIIELMEQCLITLNRPATIDEIYTYISERRSVSKTSIIVYLGREDDFAKIDRKRWGLARWAEAQNVKTWNPRQVAGFVAELFRKKKTKELKYKIVKQSLMDTGGFSKKQAQGLLNINPVIKTRRVGSELYAEFQVDYKNKLSEVGVRFRSKKKTLRQNVDESVRNILESAPTKQITTAELIAKLQGEFDRPRHTLYQYVNDLDYLEKVQVPGSRVQICRLKGSQDGLSFPQIENIATESLRKKVERVIPFLTEDDVDVGLFLLSKEFEATLKAYLIQAGKRKRLKTLPVGKTPDKWRLNNMVDCAKENEIITDQAVMHFLRQERNNRAHGSMPSLEERRILMGSVQYIAGLYIDYIKLFDDLLHNV